MADAQEVPQGFEIATLPGGVTVVGEKMNGVRSASLRLLVPAGASVDPPAGRGTATVLSELVLRGAGDRDSRQLTDHLDRLGLQRGSGAGIYHTGFSCSAPARRVLEAVPIYGDIVCRPRLTADDFEASRELALQAIAGLDDDPRGRTLIKLRELAWPHPYGRNVMGDEEDLTALTPAAASAFFSANYRPAGLIAAVAGDIDFRAYVEEFARAFEGFTGNPTPPLPATDAADPYSFEESPSEQTHIGIAWPSVPETDENYYVARIAAEILSGGMSGRLFTEVREKRGLCYSVGASYSSLKGVGSMLGYAGTTPERAQATLDQIVIEVRKFAGGVSQAELDRAKIGLKTGTIFSGESSAARSSAIASDWFIRGRLRTLEEIKTAIDGVSLARINDFLAADPSPPFRIVVVGPKELDVSGALQAPMPLAGVES